MRAFLQNSLKRSASALQAAARLVGRKPAPTPPPVSPSLARILRPQAAYRWLLPNLAAITPQYIEMTLRGALAGNHVQQWELFDLMLDSWPDLAAVCHELTDGVMRKQTIFSPYAEEGQRPTPEALDRLRRVAVALRSMRPDPAADENDLEGTLRDILSAWVLGTVVLEVDWRTIPFQSSTLIAPRASFWVHPVCYAWSMEGRLGLRTELGLPGQRDPASPNTPWASTSYQPRPTSVNPFPEHKFLIGIHKTKSGTALGGGLLRPLAWWWCAQNFSADWLLDFAQIFGVPFRWATYDPNAPDATIDAIGQMLQNMGSNGWASFPSGANLNILDHSKNGQQTPQGDLIDRASRKARELILGQTLSGSTNDGKGGGLAFGKVEAGVKADRIDAAGKFAASVINQQLIPSILTLNYGDDLYAPAIRFLEQEEGGLEHAQRDTLLINSGVPIPLAFLRKKYGLPAPEADEPVLGLRPISPIPPIPSDAPPLQAAASAATPPLASALARDLQPLRARLAAIHLLDDPDLLQAKLRQLLHDMDALKARITADPASARALADLMAQAMLKAAKK